ncbi:MAG: ABC transporter permease, partial [Planctomycetaceae bacterium]|nr:ABC transporter permease [Planctomycetaceae bacterium]
MNKILTIARREYQAMVATKAFVLGMAMMPVLMLGGMWLPKMLKGLEKSRERTIAVIDHSGEMLPLLQKITDERNAIVKPAVSAGDSESSESTDDAVTARESKESRDRREALESMGLNDINTYVLKSHPTEGFGDEQRLELSEEIRNGKLYAFLEIPADLLTAPAMDPAHPESSSLPAVTYCAQDAALSDAKRWLGSAINQLVKARRMADAGVSPVVLLELERKTPLKASGLFERNDAGDIVSEDKPDEITQMLLPMGIMMLMFMIVMMSAQPMLESVLEEKTQRISEVLLGSANARQLMTGKLLGNVGGSLTVFALYAAGGYAVANLNGQSDRIPFHILPWFTVYQLLAVLMFSSVFMAIGASVSQLREAQSLLLPVWMVMLLPMMVWFNVVREPNSTLATTLSFFPPSTPL